MMTKEKVFFCVLGVSLFLNPGFVYGTSYGAVPMNELFAEADLVVFATVVRGTGEGFESTLYEAKVVLPIKGLEIGERFYFGPYSGGAIGREYLLFLKESDDLLIAALKGDQNWFKTGRPGVVYQVMFVGFGSMEVQYTCPFEKCDYCVDVPIRHVPIPDDLERSPYDDPQSRASDFAWVRKNHLVDYLSSLTNRE